jgi:hypothetical protein
LNKIISVFYTICKNQLKIETIKLPEENIWEMLQNIGKDFLNKTPKIQAAKLK